MKPEKAIEYLEKSMISLMHQSAISFSDIQDCKQAVDVAVKTLEEIQQYREIGTVEECREGAEKQKPKKPIVGADFMVGRDDNGEPIWDSDYACPECGLGIADEYICCPYCGQVIDWGEEE